MNFEELHRVQRTERQTDSLQSLPDSFYRDAAAYVAERKAERDRVAEAADDPFSAPEVTQLTDEIETAEDAIESIYDRRIGKVVKRATFEAAGMPTDGDEGLTAEERDLFEDLVDRIAANRRDVLEAVTDAETADAGTTSRASGDAREGPRAPDPPTDPDQDRGAPDASGAPIDADGSPPDVDATASESGPDAGTDGPSSDSTQSDVTASAPDASPPGETPDATPPDPDDLLTAAMGGDANGADSPTETGTSDDDRATDGGRGDGTTTERTTLRITDDVGAIFGVDGREYRLDPEDVVTLPTANAEPLLEEGTAERLD